MKKVYLVLSFDDGLYDFKKNALPLLDKYNIKVSLNIISGYSDKTIETPFRYLSFCDVKEIKCMGHEIAIHSNTHLKKTNVKDFEICHTKIQNLLGEESYGAVLPYSQTISNDDIQAFKNIGYEYLCDIEKKKVKRPLFVKLLRVINHFLKTKKLEFVVDGYRYVYNINHFSKPFPCFDRMPIIRKYNCKNVINFVKRLKNNSCITIMLHSIIEKIGDPCEWPYGAWTVEEFDYFLSKIVKNKNIVILTQHKLIEESKRIND